MIQNLIHPYIFLLFLSGAVAWSVAVYTLRRRRATFTRSFVLMLLAGGWWSVAYGIELLQRDLEAMLFWINLEYIGIVSAPVLFFIFVCRFTGWDQWLKKWETAGLFLIPTIILIILWTNPWHGLHYRELETVRSGPLVLAAITPGPSYWISLAYSYAFVTAGMGLLLLAFRRSFPPYRAQIAIILLAILIPWLISSIYIFVTRQQTYLDYTPIAFTFTGLIIAIGLFRYQLFDLIPVARNRLVEMMEDGWIVIDQSERLADLNQTAASVLNLDREKALGQPIKRVLAASILPFAHMPQHKEVILQNGDQQRYYDVRQTSLVPGGRLIVLRDVSQRKEIEVAWQQLTQRLETEVYNRTADIEAEKDKIETVLRNIQEGVALTDSHMQVRYANEKLARMVGMNKDDLRGAPIGQALFAQTYPQYKAAIERALAAGKTWQTEIALRPGENASADHEITVIPIHKGGKGKLTGTVWTLHDISQQRKLDQARAQFVANISHEFRTPLSNLILYASLLKRLDLPERAEKYVKVLEAETARLEKITQSILTMASLDSVDTLISQETVDVKEILNTLLVQFEEMAQAKELQLNREMGEAPLPVIFGNTAYLHLALAELVKNALMMTPAGGKVALSAGEERVDREKWLAIHIEDTGPGIPLEEQPRLFERFFRGRMAESSQAPGAGLGLSIAAEIARLHRGQVTCVSEPGAGSRFTLLLPLT